MSELLLVGVGRMGRPYVSAAARLSVGVRAIEHGARADAAAEVVGEVVRARGGLDELLAEAAFAASLERPPAAVVAFSEEHVTGAALLQDAYGLPGPSLFASVLSRNKALQRACFASAGLAQPDYVVTQDLAEAAGWAATRLPVVVKPLSSAGSAGVELVPDMTSYGAMAERRAHEGRLLVETAVDGPEYSWEGLIRDGEIWFSNVTAKETSGPPHFVEVGHRAAAALGDKEAAQIDEIATAVLAAMRFRTGLVHLEFRMAEAGPTIMEVAVRTPGDYIMDIIGLTYGVDCFEMVLRLALGLPLPAAPTGPVRRAASLFLLPAPGRVKAVVGLSAVQTHPSVVHAEVKVQAGDVVGPVRSSTGRAGSVIVAADTEAELEHAVLFVRRTLRVDTSAD